MIADFYLSHDEAAAAYSYLLLYPPGKFFSRRKVIRLCWRTRFLAEAEFFQTSGHNGSQFGFRVIANA
jgi:hypothetical protein